MKSFLDKENTIYVAGKRFSFENITDEPFVSKYAGTPVTVPPHRIIEISDRTPFVGAGLGEFIALKMTGELVDKIMLGRADDVREPGAKLGGAKAASSAALLRVPAQRKILEDRILKELAPEDEATLRFLGETKIREIVGDQEKKEGVRYDNESTVVDWDNAAGLKGNQQSEPFSELKK